MDSWKWFVCNANVTFGVNGVVFFVLLPMQAHGYDHVGLSLRITVELLAYNSFFLVSHILCHFAKRVRNQQTYA